MVRKCPVCRREMVTNSERLCPRCGWELKVYYPGMSAGEKALYAKKLVIAINNWEALKAYSEQFDERDRRRGAEPAGSLDREEVVRKAVLLGEIYSESTPIPVFEREHFEYPEELKTRIEEYPPVVAGIARLIKEDYDLSTGVFQVTIVWKDWIKPLLEQLLVSFCYLSVDRDRARSICQAGASHPVYVKLVVEGEECSIGRVELYLPGKPIPIDIGFEPKPENSQKEAWKEPVTGMELEWVEGGCFLLGCGDWDGEGYAHEGPVHEISVDGFWMGRYAVTQGEWKKVMGSNPSYFKVADSYPVESVSWLDAKQFLGKLNSANDGLYGFRLPTEAEWEYACRSGGRPEKYAGGSDLDQLAWFDANSEGSTHASGGKRPNGLGLYDLSGNVWEWCEDIYSDEAYKWHQPSNPVYSKGEPDRVIRGGSWYGGANYARCAYRGYTDQTFRRHYIGFRVVRIR